MLDFSTLPRVVAVVGSREFPKLHYVDNAISRMSLDTIIVSGGARGVDQAAKEAAKKYKLRYKEYAVEGWEWTILGKRIGHVRNGVIVFYIKATKGHVLVFALEENGQLTAGSTNVIEQCKMIECGYTVLNQEGKILWTTHAPFVEKK